MRTRKNEKKHYVELAFKFVFVAVMAATIGFIGFILGFISKSSLIIACSSLAVSICMLMCSLANYYFEKSRSKTKDYR